MTTKNFQHHQFINNQYSNSSLQNQFIFAPSDQIGSIGETVEGVVAGPTSTIDESLTRNTESINNNTNSTTPIQSEAFIFKSTSSIVSDEILMQLNQQFNSDNKQIFILNITDSGNCKATNSNIHNQNMKSILNDDSNIANNTNPIQYLVVDKNVDINMILQDPNIFNQINQQTATPINSNNHFKPKTPSKTTTTTTTGIKIRNGIINNNEQIILQNENVQSTRLNRLKRRQFEFKLENKRFSYQDAFIRFLAGEKEASLDIIGDQSSQNNNINESKLSNVGQQMNNPITKSNKTKLNEQTLPSPNITINNNKTTIQSNSPKPVISISKPTTTKITAKISQTTKNFNVDYYNSSRRENLLPIVDNNNHNNNNKQGVRLNPALFKNLNSQIKNHNTSNNNTNNNSILAAAVAGIPLSMNRNNINSNNQPTTSTSLNNDKILSSRFVSNNDNNNDLLNFNNNHHQLDSISFDLNPHQHHDEINNLITDSIHHLDDKKQQKNQQEEEEEEVGEEVDINVTFETGEFLIHRSTFSGDFNNYDIWCVLEDGLLQKYEPVLLSTGERCHQSADVLAQYTPDKDEFVLVKVEEKGKTEQNNIVVGVLNEYEPKNLKTFQQYEHLNKEEATKNKETNDEISIDLNQQQQQQQQSHYENQVVLMTYDDLKATFDVLLQVLLSQHLNNEFLARIKDLQDEYFKPALELINTILNEKYQSIQAHQHLYMNSDFKNCLDNLPILNIIKYNNNVNNSFLNNNNNNNNNNSNNFCSQSSTKLQQTTLNDNETFKKVFCNSNCDYILKFDGDPYDFDTLLSINKTATPTTSTNNKNDFIVCHKMMSFSHIYHRIKHLKINFFKICSIKLEEAKIELYNSKINNTISQTSSSNENAASNLLNFCLADSDWLIEVIIYLFKFNFNFILKFFSF
jgi:hypothetical protein